MKKRLIILAAAVSAALAGCASTQQNQTAMTVNPGDNGKPVVYQTLTRLFGNTKTANIPWGTMEQNGVGKFADFTPEALAGILELGTTHIWFTGVPHHAVIHDYTAYGISQDDPDVVKGRAGSPYAVKDYYNVDPDLATDVSQRLAEFEALIARTHAAGMQVVIDIVPNHVARGYHSLSAPVGVEDFGASDNTSVEYAKHNNFYYVPGQAFRPPVVDDAIRPLGGEAHPLADGKFDENPAKWTGNGSRSVQPDQNDWYETVKINYGVKPDGSYDFPRLPAEYAKKSVAEHLAFWAAVDVPDSWKKYRDIALYWTAKGVDGFRYDVAEMVPVEFWSYLNSHIKQANPNAFLLAEIYNPSIYRDYIGLGKMDYLYDKVGTYDALRAVVEGKADTDGLVSLQHSLQDIDSHMLRFLENHDEQRIASNAFAGYGEKAKPAMVYTALVGKNATMLYFGQEVGERGDGDLGFGDPTRTSLFDYAGVPAHQRWMNFGKFDGFMLSGREKALRQFYVDLLNLSRTEPAFGGEFAELHTLNRAAGNGYTGGQFAFARWQGDDQVLVVSNFSDQAAAFELHIPAALLKSWQLGDGVYPLTELLHGAENVTLTVENGQGKAKIILAPLASMVLKR
ncbi:alpha-amylase family glycosyl hydrolase [Bowmanella sp. JS7-9]|uniref:Alpha-amylase family glycosyl hydrolase n=1 Tax=Pseudobowmanella zhangzhouensis TaxID=1537679 RepID=A0ABW1XL35_9ALTE|nr:alpha-amylase [Bowmanella sp. JS7-9]